MTRVVANIMDWSKWPLETILNQPFAPLMLVIEEMVEQITTDRGNGQPIDLSSPDFINDILSRPEDFE